MPPRLVHDHDGVLVGGQRLAEPVQERLHGRGGHLGQHEREALPRRGLHGGEQVRPGVALVAKARRALAAGEPTVADAPFLPEAGFVLEPERQALAGMVRCGPVQRALQPPFANASRAAGSALGWLGRPSAATGPGCAPAWTYAPRGSARPSAPPPRGTARPGSRRTAPSPPRQGRPAPASATPPVACRPAVPGGPDAGGRAAPPSLWHCSAARRRATLAAPSPPAAPPPPGLSPPAPPRSPASAPPPHGPARGGPDGATRPQARHRVSKAACRPSHPPQQGQATTQSECPEPRLITSESTLPRAGIRAWLGRQVGKHRLTRNVEFCAQDAARS